MQIRLSAHGAYHHQFHVVWIPKYPKKIVKCKLRKFIEKRSFDVQGYHPDIEIEKYSIQHIHLIILIPPKYSVFDIIGRIKANTSREIRKGFSWVKKIYWRNELASEKEQKMKRKRFTEAQIANAHIPLNLLRQSAPHS